MTWWVLYIIFRIKKKKKKSTPLLVYSFPFLWQRSVLFTFKRLFSPSLFIYLICICIRKLSLPCRFLCVCYILSRKYACRAIANFIRFRKPFSWYTIHIPPRGMREDWLSIIRFHCTPSFPTFKIFIYKAAYRKLFWFSKKYIFSLKRSRIYLKFLILSQFFKDIVNFVIYLKN